jgi:hypothetical protein
VRGIAYILFKKGIITLQDFNKIITRADQEIGIVNQYHEMTPVSEPWPYDTFFPKSSLPSREPYVCDIRNASHDLHLPLISIQGLVNRTSPQIYFIFNDWDIFWLNNMLEKGYIDSWIDISPQDLFDLFKDQFPCVVIPDQDLFMEPNISQIVASINDCIISKDPLPGHEIIDMSEYGFKTNAEALSWAWDTYKAEVSHHQISSIYPKEDNYSSLSTRDYFIQHKVFTFWITGDKDGASATCSPFEEMKVMMKIFSELPVNIPCRGFYWHGDGVGLQECSGVELLGEFGKITVVSDGFTNLSFHSGFGVENYTAPPDLPLPPLDPKIYVAMTMSDGDNINTLENYFPDYLLSPSNGKFPIGFGMGPSIIDLAPVIGSWYYENALPGNEFLTDVSGVGYIYPETYATRYNSKEIIFDGFLSRTDQYMHRVDHAIVRPISGGINEFEEYGLKISGLLALFPDYGRSVSTYGEATFKLSTGIPFFRTGNRYDNGIQGIISDIQSLAGTRRPAFVNAFIWNWGYKMEDLAQMVSSAPADFVFLTPAQLAKLYLEASPTTANFN